MSSLWTRNDPRKLFHFKHFWNWYDYVLPSAELAHLYVDLFETRFGSDNSDGPSQATRDTPSVCSSGRFDSGQIVINFKRWLCIILLEISVNQCLKDSFLYLTNHRNLWRHSAKGLILEPILVAARPGTWVYCRSLAGVEGSNPAGLGLSLLWVLFVVR